MLVPTIGLVAVGLALTVFAGPLLDISERAAANLMDRSVYIEAVLGGPAVTMKRSNVLRLFVLGWMTLVWVLLWGAT